MGLTRAAHARPATLSLLAWIICVTALCADLVSGRAVCQLKLKANANTPALLAEAQFSCTGGTITAAVNKQLLGGYKSSFTGIQWSPDGCRFQSVEDQARCMITVCGDSSGIFKQRIIVGINAQKQDLDSVLCFNGQVDVVLDDATVVGNTGTIMAMAEQAHVTLQNSTVTDNSYPPTDRVIYYASIVYAWGSAVFHVTGSRFHNNRGLNGGVAGAGSTASIIISESTLEGNSAEHGGAVYVWASATAVLSTVLLKNNRAINGGGAVHATSDTTVLLRSSTFTSNSSPRGGAVDVIHNAAIQLEGNNSFTGNTAHANDAESEGEGGAMYLGMNARLNDSKAVSTEYVNNSADYGGALLLEAASMVDLVSLVQFSANTAKFDGGAVYLDGTASFITRAEDTAFTLNRALAGDGGAIYARQKSLLLATSVTFEGNRAAGSGGAVFLTDNGIVGLHDVKFLNSSSAVNGGAIVALGSSSVLLRGRNVFQHNQAVEYGGAWHLGESASISDVQALETLVVNNTGSWGGAVSVDSSARASLVRPITFSHNRARSNGGAMNAVGSSVIHLAEGTFVNNTSEGTGWGGALYAGGNATVQLRNVSMLDNTADTGGALAAQVNATIVILGESMFSNNTASTDGGAVFMSGFSKMVLSGNTTLQGNTARSGGAISMMGHSQISDDPNASTNLVSNTAYSTGGAGALSEVSKGLLRGRLLVTGNKAEYGGGFRMWNDASLALIGKALKVFAQNNASEEGGAANIDSSATFLMENGEIRANTCGTLGGGLLIGSDTIEQGNTRLVSCLISQNNATDGGGLAAIWNGQLFLEDSTIVSNNALEDGAGMYMDDNSSAIVTNTSITQNVAGYSGGGVAATDYARLVMNGSSRVSHNTAKDGYGGGLALFTPNFNVQDVLSRVANNTAAYDQDISVTTANISTNVTTVRNFVSRLGSDHGTLPVAVSANGVYGLPCEGVEVVAMLGGQTLQSSFTDAKGIAQMNLKILKPPGTYTIEFSAANEDWADAVNMTVFVADCGLGNVTVSTGDACEACPAGYYSLDPRNTTCDKCVAGAECPGGSDIIPLPGLWHSSRFSTQIHRCFNPAACQGNRELLLNNSYGNDYFDNNLQCSEGHKGNLCGVCAAGWARVMAFTCRRCMDKGVIILLYAVASLAMLGFLKAMCYFTLQDGISSVRSESSNSLGSSMDGATVTEMMKPLIIWSQYMLVVSGLNVEWPRVISLPVQALAWFWSSSSPQTIGLECLQPAIPVAVLRVVLGISMPVLMMLLILLIDVIVVKSSNSKAHALHGTGRVARTACVVAFTFLPAVARTLFGLFACVPLDTAVSPPYVANAIGSFWESDMSQQCYRGYHRIWAFAVGLPLVVVVCLVLPACIVYFTWRNLAKLDDVLVQRHWGFLYHTYKRKYCWWEAVVLCQTCVLVAVSVFGFTVGAYYQALLLNALLSLAGVLLLVVKPHASHMVGVITVQSYGCLFLISYLALAVITVGNIQPSSVYKEVVGALVLVANFTFVVSVLYKVVKLIDFRQLKEMGTKAIYGATHVCGMQACMRTACAPCAKGKQSKFLAV